MSVIQTNVETAIGNYLDSLDFDGSFLLIKLVDYIQSVEGVEDILINEAKGKPFGASDFDVFNRVYNTVSGSLKIDPDNELTDTITYTVF